MGKKLVICLISGLLLINSGMIVNAADYSAGTNVDISDEDGSYTIAIENAHDVDWDSKRDGVKIITIQGIAENIDYDKSDKGLSCYHIAQTALQVKDDEGFDLEFYDISSGNDGVYEVSADIMPSSKKRISLPYYAPENCETVTVVINNDYSIEFALDGSGVVENGAVLEEEESTELQTAIDQEPQLESESIENDNIEEQDLEVEVDTETENLSEAEAYEPDESSTGEIVTESDPSDFLYVVNEGEVYIRSYNGNETNVVIPSEIDGATVTTIGEKAFENNETIQSVTFPDSISTIGSEAFHKCKNLEAVHFPVNRTENLTIAKDAFDYCNISGTVVINARTLELGVGAFALNKNLTDFIILSDEIVFRDHPFEYCSAMKAIYIKPDATTSYDGYYINSKEGDVFTELESLGEVYLNTDCSFLTERTFENSPNVIIYVPEGSATVDYATELWLPTNTAEYDEKTSKILDTVSDLGYNLNDDVSENTEISGGEQSADNSEASQNTETISKVQEALNDLGYDCGTADGVAGSQTQYAIQQYQVENGLEVSGEINDELLSSLGIN